MDLKGSECTWSYQTPPSSPSTTVSRKSSMCRLVTMATADCQNPPCLIFYAACAPLPPGGPEVELQLFRHEVIHF